VVTLTKDKYVQKGPGRPIFNENLRAETVASLQIVDYVCLLEEYTAVGVINRLKPDIYAKGQDYKEREQDVTGKIFDEEEAVTNIGGEIYFTEDITFSSSSLINEFLDILPAEKRNYLRYIADKYPSNYIIDQVKDLQNMNVLVIGDAIIDEYHYCEPLGKSLKSSLLVNKYLSEESFAGGSMAVANHVAGLCEKVYLVTLLGQNDSREEFILGSLKPNIQPKFFYRTDAPTIVKQRFVYNLLDQKLFEVCYINDNYIQGKLEAEILEFLRAIIPKYDLVIVSDFGHGFLSPNLIETIKENARFLAVNTQTNSANIGYNLITKYHQPNFACLDEPEARLAAQDREGDIKDVGLSIVNKIKSESLIITRGNDGSLGFRTGNEIHQTPAFASKIVDRVGAGDAFFAFTAPCFAKGMPLDLTSFVGNAVGALAVQIVANRESVDPISLFKFITTLLK